jgi:hypothetical protein
MSGVFVQFLFGDGRMGALDSLSDDLSYLRTGKVSGFKAVTFLRTKHAERRFIEIGPIDTELPKNNLKRIPNRT